MASKIPARLSLRRPLWLLATVVAFAVTLAMLSPRNAAAGGQDQNRSKPALIGPAKTELSETAIAQIQALAAEKANRTPAQRKLDSQLLYAAKQSRGVAVASGLPTLETDIKVGEDGLTSVAVACRDFKTVTAAIGQYGGRVEGTYAFAHSIEARLPLGSLEALAELPEVLGITPHQDAVAWGAQSPETEEQRLARLKAQDREQPEPEVAGPVTVTPEQARAARIEQVREKVRAAIATVPNSKIGRLPATPKIGSSTVQGDVTHKANLARSAFGYDGTGIKIGVLSDGVNSLGARQATGDLPPNVTVLPGQAGSGDEGTAMLEIVYDLAPGAQLFFATAFTSITSFAQNIRDLRAAGCDVIVDDVFYFTETGLHQGQSGTVVSPNNCAIVTQAVNDVTASGALYFSSAGNSGNKNDNTSGSWEGDFASAGNLAAVGTFPGGDVLDFDQTAAVSNNNPLTGTGGSVTMHWSDPLGTSSNDYDVYRFNSTLTTVQAASTNVQSGTNSDPFERVATATGSTIVVLRTASAQPRFISMSANRNRFQFNTDGQTRGHATAPNGFGVAATPSGPAVFGAPPNPIGPFPNPHNATNTVELFSSDGPRRFFYAADGTILGNGGLTVGAGGGVVLQKPDITAADGVTTTTPGFIPFFGTSAAAPHAAAIAALVKSVNPALTPAQVRTALNASAIDIEGTGVDRDSGVGIIMALEALQTLNPTPIANLQTGTVTATRTPSAGPILPGDSATLSVALNNTGAASATGISATLTTSTSCVTITSNTSAYANIAANASGTNTTPFAFSLSSACLCPTRVDFTLTVTFSGGSPSASPQVFNFSVDTGPPATSISATLGTPGTGAGFSSSTGTQLGRIVRANPASTCAAPKAFPGIQSTTGSRRFDAYTFTASGSNNPLYCVTSSLTLNSGANGSLYMVVYRGSVFSPADLGDNYLADLALSGANAAPNLGVTANCSFNVQPGETFTVVIHEVNASTSPTPSYTLRVGGLCGTTTASLLDRRTVTATEAGGDGDTFIEPCEGGQLNVQLRNIGSADATPVSATLTTSTPGVNITQGTAAYPMIPARGTATNSTPFAFNLNSCAPCGLLINFTLTVSYGNGFFSPQTFNFSVQTGSQTFSQFASENFDGVTAPALPAGWTASTSGATPPAAFATVATGADTAPNAVFTDGSATVATNALVSPTFTLPAGTSTRVTFRHTFNFEGGFDGGVLEISVNGGPFLDVTDPAIGGVFAANGYNNSVSPNFSNAIGGRRAWSGAQAAFVTPTLDLPTTLAGRDVRFRWLAGWDTSSANANPNWRIDTFTLSQRVCNSTACNGASLNCAFSLSTGTVTVEAPTCGANGYSNDVVVNATLTNNGAVPITGAAFQVVELREANGTPPTVPFRLLSATGATCTSGGLVGSTQPVPGTIAPGASVPIQFRIAAPTVRRFRFFVNVIFGAVGVNSVQPGKTASIMNSFALDIDAKTGEGRVVAVENKPVREPREARER